MQDVTDIPQKHNRAI